jgi:hypothetical protein
VAQVVEYLHTKPKALSSNPTTAKQQQQKEQHCSILHTCTTVTCFQLHSRFQHPFLIEFQ